MKNETQEAKLQAVARSILPSGHPGFLQHLQTPVKPAEWRDPNEKLK